VPSPARNAIRAKQLHQRQFRRQIPPAADFGHHIRTLGFGEDVRHLQSQPRRTLAGFHFLYSDFAMAYKIEMKYVYGWDDAGWTYEDDEPMRFGSIDEARAEVEYFFAKVNDAAIDGTDPGYSPSDFRIVVANEVDERLRPTQNIDSRPKINIVVRAARHLRRIP
jgi:hypothetical protein